VTVSAGRPDRDVRVLIVDDHALFRYGMRAMFGSTPGYEVVGEAADGEEALRLFERLHPDVVLMDLQMPGMNGIEATRRLVGAHPDLAVVVVTMLGDDDSVFAAMRAGARGYVLKGADGEEVIEVVNAAVRGEAHFGSEIAARIMGFFSAPRPAPPAEAFPDLTAREVEVLDLMARGMNNAEIARRLYLSPKTVRNHASKVFLKLQVPDRSHAIVRAREAGLGRGTG
jgi:DNA-binding NarL/FixJ family response regulator